MTDAVAAREPLDLRLVPPAAAAWFAAALACGAPDRWTLTAAGAALGTAMILLVARRGPGPPRTAATALLCAAAAAVAAVAHSADLWRGPLPALARDHRSATVDVTVTADPIGGRFATFEAQARRITADGTTWKSRNPVLVVARGSHSRDWLALLPSTRLTLHALLMPPLDPGDRYAAVLHVRGPPRITRAPSAVQRAAGGLRAGLRTATDGLRPDARALLPGLVIGDTSRVPPELIEDFRATDLSHLLSVSGANLTILLAVLIGPPGRAGRAERGGLAPRFGLSLRLTAVLGGLLTLGFVVLCRPDPSVLRAAACGLITLLAIGTGRRRSMLPALAAAVLLLVFFVPALARSYGFLLSVLATGALLTLAPRWSEALQRRGVPGRLAEILAAAAAAQAVCAPVVAVIASRVSLVAIPCNLLAELAVAPATVLGFAALAAAPVAMPLAKCLAWLAGWPTEWIAALARRGAAMPGADVAWPGGWTGGLLLAAAVLIAIPVARRVLHRPVLCTLAAFLLLIAVLRPAPLGRVITGWPPEGWRMVACDVGQGDALVLSAGAETAVVVDTGPDPDAVDGCLRELGITRIPLLVLTHFHADHVTGLPGVLHGRAVGAIETTTLDEPPEQRVMVLRQATAARIPVIRALAGEERRIGPLSWRVLWPTVSGIADDDPNDSSVVMLVRLAGLTILLLGDVEPPAQRRLLTSAPGLPAVDVLKVAHHGSAFQDPALMRRLHPRLALISCGRDNPYGHPSPRTITALRSAGTTVLRTDTDGSLAVLGGEADLRAASTDGR